MKKLIPLLIGCSLLSVPASLAQATVGGPPTLRLKGGTTPPEESQDIRFDLEFPGGAPEKLVKAIEKSAGKPLNAIIPPELANEQLPALRMKSVTVKDLFKALQQSTTKSVRYQFGGSMQMATTSSGFQTQGTPDYESIWYFYKTAPNEQAESKVCRFYNLAPFLETYKVEDITTAVQTGWKMLGETSPPVLNYHQDTKLLIVVGEPTKLGLIDTVLSELGKYPIAKVPKPSIPPLPTP